MGEALRLGGWVHGAPMIPYIWRRDHQATATSASASASTAPSRAPARWRRWPPVPASQPNFVGIDGVLEGLCPPYVHRHGRGGRPGDRGEVRAGGAYGSTRGVRPGLPRPASAEAYLTRAQPHPPEAIAYTKEICRYLVETYGRFPAHTDAFHLPGIWVQFSHLEIEYYERFGQPGLRAARGRGPEIWGR